MGVDADQKGHQTEHAQADDDRAVPDGRGDEGRLDQVLADREQALGDGLIADRIGEHGDEERRPLLEDRLGREEVRLLLGHPAQAFRQDGAAACAEEHPRNDDDRDGHHGHDLGEVGQDRGAKAGPEGVRQDTDAGDQHPCLERQGRKHGD